MTTPSQGTGPKGTGTIIAAEGAAHARIMGVGGYRPERVVPNSEIIEAIDSSDEWIQERSGIKERRFAAKDESVVDMSVEATRGALEAAGLEAAEVHVAAAPGDPISWSGWFGASPWAERFGAEELPVGPGTGHSDYLDAGRPTLPAVGAVVAGRGG